MARGRLDLSRTGAENSMALRFEVKKRDVQTQYRLPAEVKFCKRCTISNQRPRIGFDEDGICTACRFADFKKTGIDWKLRKKELEDLCDRHRKNDGSYDVIVPGSGGKDGSYVAHQLKHEFGMNPLTVTWAPHIYTDIGKRNFTNFVNSGFTNILGTPDGQVHRKMTRLSFIHLGDPFQPFIYGQYNFPIQISVRFNIPLIMYGENGEVEYGGDMKNAYRPNRDIEDAEKHYFSGLPPEFWKDHGISQRDIHPYLPPPFEMVKKNKSEVHFFSYYKYWDPQENYYYCTEKTGFSAHPERSEGTYSKYASLDDRLDGYHYYLMFMKFGIGRTTSDTAHEVRDEKITRDEGIALIKKYDGEFPKRYYDEFLTYCDLTDEEAQAIFDSWRGDHIWQKDETTTKWRLRKPIWEESR
jgi:N-acetyl sugar amidotransferase